MSYFENVPRWIREIPSHLRTQEMCGEVYNVQKMCNEAVEIDPWQLYDVPYYLKTQKMCDDVAQRDSYSLQFFPGWFVTQEQLEMWHDEDDYCNDLVLIEWYKRYEKWKAQKASIKKELMPIAWHSSRWWDWCVSEDEKKETETFFFLPLDTLRIKMY